MLWFCGKHSGLLAWTELHSCRGMLESSFIASDLLSNIPCILSSQKIDLIGDSENLVDGYLICVPRTTIYVLVNVYAVEGV